MLEWNKWDGTNGNGIEMEISVTCNIIGETLQTITCLTPCLANSSKKLTIFKEFLKEFIKSIPESVFYDEIYNLTEKLEHSKRGKIFF